MTGTVLHWSFSRTSLVHLLFSKKEKWENKRHWKRITDKKRLSLSRKRHKKIKAEDVLFILLRNVFDSCTAKCFILGFANWCFWRHQDGCQRWLLQKECFSVSSLLSTLAGFYPFLIFCRVEYLAPSAFSFFGKKNLPPTSVDDDLKTYEKPPLIFSVPRIRFFFPSCFHSFLFFYSRLFKIYVFRQPPPHNIMSLALAPPFSTETRRPRPRTLPGPRGRTTAGWSPRRGCIRPLARCWWPGEGTPRNQSLSPIMILGWTTRPILRWVLFICQFSLICMQTSR